MNVEVVCLWVLTCEQCQGVAGHSIKQPLTPRPPRPCPCGAEFGYEWRPDLRVYLGDEWFDSGIRRAQIIRGQSQAVYG